MNYINEINSLFSELQTFNQIAAQNFQAKKLGTAKVMFNNISNCSNEISKKIEEYLKSIEESETKPEL